MDQQKAHYDGLHVTGTIPSLKNKGSAPFQSIRYESTIERDEAILLEFDADVLRYYDHPFPIIALFPDGTKHQYTPDFQVIRRASKAIVECKPEKFLDQEDTKRQREIGEAWAAANEHEFILVTDTVLRAGPRLANVKILWRYRLLAVPTAVMVCCFTYLAEHSHRVPFGELAAHLSSPEAPLAHAGTLYSLLFQHLLETDLNQPLTPQSLIWRSAAI